MILELIVMLTSGLLVTILVLVLSKIISNRLALIKFKKVSRGIPMCPEAKLLGNHLISISMARRSCKKLLKWHEEMGKNIGWLKSNTFCVSTTDLDFIKRFIYDEPDTHMDRPKLHFPAAEIDGSILFEPRDEWRPIRKAIAPAFTPNKFKTPNVQEEIEDSIQKLIGLIEKKLATEKPGHLFDVDDLIQRYSASLVARNFYKQENLIDFHDPNDIWVRLIDTGLKSAQDHVFVKISMIFPITKNLIDWLMWNFTPEGFTRKTFLGFVKAQTKLGMEARKQLDEKKRKESKAGTGEKVDGNNFLLKDGTEFKRNMVDHIIDQFLDGKLTKEKYFDNAVLLMAAANRTASDCIVHTIYLLSTHLDVQEKLRVAIKADGSEADYLDWVLKESLRLLPTAPLGCSRVMAHDMETKEGYLLPAGTFVHTNAFVIHRLKEYWGEDAEEFRPERWQDTSDHHPMQFIAFGAGPRGCPGRLFAMHQMKMLFAALLTRYKFEGQLNDDAYNFSSPFWIFLIPDSTTRVTIKKLQDV